MGLHKKGPSYPNGDWNFGFCRTASATGAAFWTKRGVTYTGEWAKGGITGKGSVKLRNGRVFTGEFVNCKPQGKGMCATQRQPDPRPCLL